MSIVGSAADVVTRPIKDAFAANEADEQLDHLHALREFQQGKDHSAVYDIGKSVGDKAMDALNVATFGVARHITNIGRDADEKIQYKELKQARKSRELDDSASITDRAQYLGSAAVGSVDTRSASVRALEEAEKANKRAEQASECVNDNNDVEETEDEKD